MVRILAVSDIHGNQSGFLTSQELIMTHTPDILVIAGDITHFGPAKWAREYIESFELPMLAVNGNCDTEDVISLLKEHDAGLLNSCREFRGMNFLGLQYPFPEGFEPANDFDILVAHIPPRGCNDFVPGPGNIGDEKLKKFVIKHRPILVLSGHAHEARGICLLDGATCVNPGPAMDGNGAVIDIDGDRVQARLVETI